PRRQLEEQAVEAAVDLLAVLVLQGMAGIGDQEVVGDHLDELIAGLAGAHAAAASCFALVRLLIGLLGRPRSEGALRNPLRADGLAALCRLALAGCYFASFRGVPKARAGI